VQSYLSMDAFNNISIKVRPYESPEPSAGYSILRLCAFFVTSAHSSVMVTDSERNSSRTYLAISRREHASAIWYTEVPFGRKRPWLC
jgi:hypothetical protein